MSLSKDKFAIQTFNFFCFIVLSIIYLNTIGVGRDIEAIRYIFNKTNEIYWVPIEFLFNNSILFFRLLNLNADDLIITFQLLGLILNFYAFRRITQYYPLILCLLIPNFFLASFSTIQQFIVMPLLFLAEFSKSNGNRFLFYFISVLFHWVAIPLIVIRVVVNFFSPRIYLYILFLVVLLVPLSLEISYALITFISGNEIYSNLIESLVDSGVNNNLIFPFFFFVSMVFAKKFINFSHQTEALFLSNNFKLIFSICLLTVIIVSFGFSGGYIFRVLNFALLPMLFLIYNMNFTKESELLFKLILFIVLIMNFCMSLYTFGVER